MPLLDLSELMDDPDFSHSFEVVRERVTANDRGRPDVAQESFPAVGSIQPAPASSTENLPEGTILGGAIDIYTRFILTDGSLDDDLIADTVIYKNIRFTVMSVSDYSDWGQGWVKATAVLSQQQKGDAP